MNLKDLKRSPDEFSGGKNMFIKVTKEKIVHNQVNTIETRIINSNFIVSVGESGDETFPYAVSLSNGKVYHIKENLESILSTDGI